MIDIRLKTFLALAKIKNYTQAAQILNITQPAVSQHIKFLEDYYGVLLFRKRQCRAMDLTDEGKILFKYAEEIENLYRLAETDIKNKPGNVKTYNVGATLTIGGYVLPSILAKYKKLNKNITILLQVHNTQEIIEKLLTRKLDFALVEGPFDKRVFKFKKYKDDELILAVSPMHCFANRKQVDITEIIKGNLILREKGSGTRKIFEDKLVEQGYDLQNVESYMEIGSISAIKSLVESNLGYTIISRETIKKELGIGTIKVVPIKEMHIFREYNFIYLPDKEDEFIHQFMDFCLKNLEV